MAYIVAQELRKFLGQRAIISSNFNQVIVRPLDYDLCNKNGGEGYNYRQNASKYSVDDLNSPSWNSVTIGPSIELVIEGFVVYRHDKDQLFKSTWSLNWLKERYNVVDKCFYY